jgi:hypothetical protein
MPVERFEFLFLVLEILSHLFDGLIEGTIYLSRAGLQVGESRR